MDKKTSDSFGLRMKEVIRMVGSADRLARLAGMSARAIGQYAAGTSDPTRGKIIALATAAGVNVLWLLTGEGSKDSAQAAVIRENSHPEAAGAEGLPQAVCETVRLIQELGTRQIELEQQNEELRQAREG